MTIVDSEIIHFPGPVMTFAMTCRQRCAWCGALIQEIDMANVSIQESSRREERRGMPYDADDFAWFNGLVAIDSHENGPSMLRAVEDPADGKAPERSCMMLMPAEV